MGDVRSELRAFLVEEFFVDRPDVLRDDSELHGVLGMTSMDIYRLVGFVEDTFGVSVTATEAETHFDTLEHIAAFVERKRAPG